MNVGDLITACGALIAILVAIFAILFPHVVQSYKTRWKSMVSIDMPWHIRNNKRFRFEIFLDTFVEFMLSITSLLMALWFTSILVNTIAVNIGQKPVFLFFGSLPQEFLNGAQILWWILALMFTSSLMLLAAGSIVSGNLPLIFKAYVFITMDTRASTDLSQELLSEARALVTQQKYNDAILDATTSLEYKIRSMLDLEHTESFAAIMTRLSKTTVLGQEITRELF